MRLRQLGFLAVGGALALLAPQARPAAAAGMPIGNPYILWEFVTYLTNLQGETYSVHEGPYVQIGGQLDEKRDLSFDGVPNLELFTNLGATTFWDFADAPHPVEDDRKFGCAALLHLAQSFRKDLPGASLSFVITGATLIGVDPSPPGDGKQPTGDIVIGVQAKDELAQTFFTFLDTAHLEGLGHEQGWNYEPPQHLALEASAGALDQDFVQLTLSSPFRQEIDLSTVGVGEVFTVYYDLNVSAIDTAHYDSAMTIFARDPLDRDTGSSFEYAGLTPTDDPVVPEPARPVLLLVGLAVLFWVRDARRRTLALHV